jgi:putative DNA primase/helicase
MKTPTKQALNGHVSTNGSAGMIRFTPEFRCPVCGGCDSDPRGRGVRCATGFMSADREWIHCGREEHARGCRLDPSGRTWTHKAKGPCPCGKEHAPADWKPTKASRPKKLPPSFKTLDEAVKNQAAFITAIKKVGFVATAPHQYTESFATARFDQVGGGEKEYRPFRRDSDGWRALDPPGLLPLYLGECVTEAERTAAEAELAAATVVDVFEGEKCVNLARDRLDLIAVTSSHGALSPQKTDWSLLAGKEVRLWPDNDDDGQKCVQDVATITDRLDVKPTVRIVSLPLENQGDDFEQWLDGVNDSWGPEECRAELDRLASLAPIWSPSPASKPRKRRARLIRASDIQQLPLEWLIKPYIPLGMLSMFAGDPKLAKSLVTLTIAAAVSRGYSLFGDRTKRDPASVILMSAEDDAARVVIPRLKAAGADLSRIHILESIMLPGNTGKDDDYGTLSNERLPSIVAEDIGAIEEAAKGLGDCRLIIVDPVTAYLSGTDGNDNVALRGVLHPFKAMVERLNTGTILTSHTSKGGSTQAKHRVIGSIAWVATCRANFLFVKDADDPSGRRVLMLENGVNLTKEVPGVAYVVEDTEDGPVVTWDTKEVTKTADEALAALLRDPEQQADRRKCEKWLTEKLTDGPRLAVEIELEGKDEGYGADTLKRAKRNIGAKTTRDGFGKKSRCWWGLDGAAVPSSPSLYPSSNGDVH